MRRFYNSLISAGFNAEIRPAKYGQYWDGEEHGYFCEVLQVVFWHDEASAEDEQTFLDMLKKRKRLVLQERHWTNVYSRFDVIASEDREKACNAVLESNIFLDAFWQAIHEKKPQEEAVKAGKLAVMGF